MTLRVGVVFSLAVDEFVRERLEVVPAFSENADYGIGVALEEVGVGIDVVDLLGGRTRLRVAAHAACAGISRQVFHFIRMRLPSSAFHQ